MEHNDILLEIESVFKDYHLRQSLDLKSLLKLKLRLIANEEALNFLFDNLHHFDKFEREILLEAIFEVLTEKLEDDVREVNVKVDMLERRFGFTFLSVDFWRKWVGIVMWILVVAILTFIVFTRIH
ncbi:hypothetical protein DRP05_13670 [Archaeoglobales archaeon]|nr:MAG: hypothetical protein DRP05_13670 [Archaeoglobales archaeon]